MLIQIINRILNTGINAQTNFDLRNKLRVFNSAVLVIFFISCFYCVIGIVNCYWIAVGVTFYSIASNVFSLILVRLKLYKAAFHYTVWYGFIFLSAFNFLFGGANNSYYYFLFMPVAVCIMFDSLRVIISYVFLCAVFMIGSIHFIENYPPYYDMEAWMRNFSYPNILFVTFLIYLGVRLFKSENLGYASEIIKQKKVLEEKNREITDSINYASKIQSSLIPAEEEFKKYFKEAFVLFKPKDIVSGDFYWVIKSGDYVFYATGDCTGHGVPGGFMTMLGISFLDEIINEKKLHEPSQILDALRERIISTLKQTGNSGESKDGMDIVLCRLNTASRELTYSGANNSLYVLRNNAFTEHKPDKQPCGFYDNAFPFTQKSIQLNENDRVYTFTDGYADQFGGTKGKKFKYKKLEDLTLSLQSLSLHEQKQILETTFNDWKGNLEQIDDVCMIGITV